MLGGRARAAVVPIALRALRAPTLISVAVLGLVAYLPTLLSSPGKMPADTKLYLYLDPGGLTTDAPYTFDPSQYAGWVPHQHITYLWPSGPWFWLFENLGVPDWVAHRLWLGTVFFMAGLGVRWLARTLGIGVPGALVAAFVYQVSPFVLPYVSRTSLMLLPWAGLGWIVALTARAATRSRWRDAALLALVIATVGSPNATALVMIAPAPMLWLIHAAWMRSITWRSAVVTALRIGILSIAVSLWWIAMLVVQGRYGADVLAYSESLEAVSSTSSANEVLRGLGFWVFYLHDLMPSTTASHDYLTSVPVITAGYVLVGVGLLGLIATRWAHRRYGLLLFVVGVLLGVGVHRLDDPAPITDWIVDDTSSGLALALRSSTRAVPLVTLALALGAGTLVAAVRPRRHWGRALVPVGIVVLAVINMPSLWHHDYVDPVLERDQDPPDAWLEAAADLDSKPSGYRVLQVPGEEFGSYRWGYTVDQPLPGLTERPVVTRDVLPLGSPQAMDLLYALDDRFQAGLLEPQAIAPVARLFGADTLWLANDTAFDRQLTPRPEVTVRDVGSQPAGLGEPVPYGEPAANRPFLNMTNDESVTLDEIGEALPPVMLVPVDDPLPVVRAKTGDVVLSGDGDGVVDAAAAGLIDGTELLRYSADVAADDGAAITDADALIVTDSNRDRARRWNSSQDSVGFTESGGTGTDLLRADDADSRIPTFANTDPATQTIAEQVGPVTATASGYGEPFAYRPEDRAAMAIDGDPSTAWRVADRFFIAGEKIVLETDDGIDHIRLLQPRGAQRGRHITAIQVRVSGYGPQRLQLDDSSMRGDGQRFDLPPTAGPTRVEITIKDARSPTDVPGPSNQAVGFAEIDVGLGSTTEVVRPPSDLLARLGERDADAPFSMLLTRSRADARDRYRSDPEPSMIRGFDLPVSIDLEANVTARLNPRVPDGVLNDLLGIRAPTTSGRVSGDLRSAGWATVDGDLDTAWISPFAFVHGEWITVPLPSGDGGQSFTITQPRSDDFSRITSLRVESGRRSWRVPVPRPDADGASTIHLPRPLRGERVRIVIDDIAGRVIRDRRYGEPVYLPAAISEISIGPRIDLPETVTLDCRSDLLDVGGDAVSVRLTGSVDALFDGEAFTAEPCSTGSESLQLAAGEHLLTSAAGKETGIDIDRVELSTGPTTGTTGGSMPAATVTSSERTSRTIDVGPCPDGCWLVLGEGYNEAWEASSNGDDLGAPSPVDGGFNGWWIEPSDSTTTVHVEFTAQRTVTLALLFSGIAVLACVALVVIDRRRREKTPDRPIAAGLVGVGKSTSLTNSVVSAAGGVAAAAVFIQPEAALWVALVGVAVIVTQRPRLAGYAAVGLALYVGAATAWKVHRDHPPIGGNWLLHVEWLHRYALGVVILALMALIGATSDRAPRRSASDP